MTFFIRQPISGAFIAVPHSDIITHLLLVAGDPKSMKIRIIKPLIIAGLTIMAIMVLIGSGLFWQLNNNRDHLPNYTTDAKNKPDYRRMAIPTTTASAAEELTLHLYLSGYIS